MQNYITDIILGEKHDTRKKKIITNNVVIVIASLTSLMTKNTIYKFTAPKLRSSFFYLYHRKVFWVIKLYFFLAPKVHNDKNCFGGRKWWDSWLGPDLKLVCRMPLKLIVVRILIKKNIEILVKNRNLGKNQNFVKS